MKKLLMMIGAAAVAVGANATVVTQTVDGVTWQIDINTSTKKAKLGTGSHTQAAEAAARAVLSELPKSLVVPSTFVIDGSIYSVDHVAERAFPRDYGGGAHNITFPLDVDTTFDIYTCPAASFTNVLFKGPSTVAKGGAQTYSTLTMPNKTYSILQGCANVKFVVMGPNVKVDNKNKIESFLNKASNATVLVPRRSGNMTWDGSADISLGGTDNVVAYYGPGEEFDIEMGATTVTMIPTTANALTNVLTYAKTFKTAFGLDARINVTNSIEIGEGLITAETLEYATFNSLMFKVNTQAQLDSVLAAIPSTVPFAIDASDSKSELIVPQGREVWARLSAEGRQGKYTPKITGLIISYH